MNTTSVKQWATGLTVAATILLVPTLVAGTEMPAKTPRCIVIASDADHGPRLAGRYDYAAGVWTQRGTAKVLGYSKHEDSVIYNTARCAQNGASYVR